MAAVATACTADDGADPAAPNGTGGGVEDGTAPSSSPTSLMASFDHDLEVDPSGGTVCVTEWVQFTDTSTGDPVEWVWTIRHFDETVVLEEQNPRWLADSTGGRVEVRLELMDAAGATADATEDIDLPVC